MKNPTYAITIMCLSALTSFGCQAVPDTAPTPIDTPAQTIVSNQLSKDSDGDGVPDELDQCPATPYNVVIDERGCPFAPIGVGLKMEYRAFFPKDSSELAPKHQIELDKIAAKMREYDKSTFRIEAHASKDEVNEALNSLTKNRARMVKNYLLLNHSIAADRLSTADCGAKAPIASSDSKDVVLNRRVYGLLTEPEDGQRYQNSNGSESGTCVSFK